MTRSWYLSKTDLSADYGGEYKEGMVGFPRYINPILAQTNDVDRDITKIIFSGLLKYNYEGKLEPDLAEKYSISPDGKTYTFSLKRNIKWHDGKNLTADDVIWTIQAIQNPDYKSPLRMSWRGIEMEKIDDFTFSFKIGNVYVPFLGNLTFGILPKHLWEKISSVNFPLAEYNLKPIGSGPYKFKEIQKDKAGTIKSLKLESWSDYYFKEPYIETIIFKFFKDEDSAIGAYNSKEVDGLNFISAANVNKLKNNFNLNKFIFPRYFAVFFNQTQSKVLSDKNIRQALAYGVNKDELIEKALSGQAQIVNLPLPEIIFKYNHPLNLKTYNFNLKEAAKILDEAKWLMAEKNGINLREKTFANQNLALEFSLMTVETPELIQIANLLKSNWEKIGVKINLEIKSTAEIQENIRSRQYQALLFGEVLGLNPDPFAFWHSSQKKDPGLNLSLYDSKEVDKLLEEIRQELNEEIKNQKYEQFQRLILEDLPAIFLYSPVYLCPVSKNIKVDDLYPDTKFKIVSIPSERFSQIEKWYIETKRVWK